MIWFKNNEILLLLLLFVLGYLLSPYIKNNFPVNEEIYVSGKLEFYKNKYQITHPDYILKPKEIKDLTIEVYKRVEKNYQSKEKYN